MLKMLQVSMKNLRVFKLVTELTKLKDMLGIPTREYGQQPKFDDRIILGSPERLNAIGILSLRSKVIQRFIDKP